MKRLLCLGAAFGCLGFAQAGDRTKPPVSPPIPDYKMPAVYEAKLPNGLTVLLLDDDRFPLVTLRLAFAAGSSHDPKDLPGLAEVTASLLTEGTESKSSRQIAEELASIGGNLNGSASPDALILAGSALSENTARLLDLAADVARHANFPENEVKLRIQNREQELAAQRSDPGFLIRETFTRVIFGPHPYSHMTPTLESLERMDRAALAGFEQHYLVPNNAVLLLLGRLPERASAMKLIEERFGSWERKALPEAPGGTVPPPKRQIVLVDRPGSVQADIYVGRVALTRRNPEYFPLSVATTILGGGASSRMFMDIREKQGFAYDAHASLDPLKDSGSFEAVTQVRNAVFEPALQAVLDHLSAMAEKPVTAEEVSRAKNLLSGFFLLRLQTQNALAQQLIAARMAGLPNNYLEQYTGRVRAVTEEQVHAAARDYMAPGNAAIVVVGDASKIGGTLRKFGEVRVTKAD